MAVGTAVYPGQGPNTFVKSMQATDNLVVSYSRNPQDFPLARYVQYKSVTKDSGYYLVITAENAARIVGGNLRAEEMQLVGFAQPGKAGEGEARKKRRKQVEEIRRLTEGLDLDTPIALPDVPHMPDADISENAKATGRRRPHSSMSQNIPANELYPTTDLPPDFKEVDLSEISDVDYRMRLFDRVNPKSSTISVGARGATSPKTSEP